MFLSQQQRGQPAHRVAHEVGSCDPETVEEGLGGADEEWDGNARQVGTGGLATTGDIVREIENGPGLTGRMGNEITPVLFGRTEAMQTDDRGEMGYPGIGAGH